MKRRAALACAAVVVALLSGCSERIDPSTPETTQKSIEELQNSLPEEKRAEFSRALGVVIANALGGGYKDVGDTPEGRARVREALRGKTANDIIAEAARLEQESKQAKQPKSS